MIRSLPNAGFLLFIAFAFNAPSAQAVGAPMSLEDFLGQVRTGNGAVAAARETSAGASQRSVEGQDLFAPALNAAVQFYSDERITNNPAFMGTKTQQNSYSLGLSQLTSFGLKAKASYNILHTSLTGVNPAFVPQAQFYDAYPKLELSQSLWNNGFGATAQAQQELIEASALATHYSESAKLKLELTTAEASYWRLAFARKTILVQLSTRDRAEAIKEWSAKRARLQLADRSDLLQAEAALKIRTLDLQAARDEERAAAHAFNLARGREEDSVNEALTEVSPPQIQEFTAPARGDGRDDVKAAGQLSKIASANAKIAGEKTKPTLELAGFYTLNGRDPALGTAAPHSVKTDHPQWVTSLNFVMPLDFETRGNIKQGWARERVGAELSYDRKRFEEDRDWHDLIRRFRELKSRLELASSIEGAQLEKLRYEKARLDRGRTTTYQVLLFEQDYALARLSTIQYQSNIMQLLSQMKLYDSSGGPQ